MAERSSQGCNRSLKNSEYGPQKIHTCFNTRRSNGGVGKIRYQREYHQPISPDLERFYDVFFETGCLSKENLKKAFPQAELKQLMDNNPFVGPPIDIEMAMKNLT